MPDISPYLGLPEVASAHGAELDYMLGLVHWLMLILFVIWAPFFIYVLIRFRASKNPRASYTGAKGRLAKIQEGGVIIAELVLLFAFAIPAWAVLKVQPPDENEAVVVRVTGEQFAWNIHYPGADGAFGKQDIKLVDTQTNPLGIDFNDPGAMDDLVTVNELHLPAGKPAIIHLGSKDVIHSFALNAMRVKQDAIPGISVPVYFTPTKPGNYEISCAQLCGLGHYRMRGKLVIHTPEEYRNWLQKMAQDLEEYGR
ncbi:MAG: cytochrome c oxidase subunit II [Calditrichaceae bacterium]|nr:cytochrome c oxidase subunit II [Calditrichia bacterium]NUQ40390.1 cytochrome c oxidase subunit II [Calditrichaceae bacterium]